MLYGCTFSVHFNFMATQDLTTNTLLHHLRSDNVAILQS